MKHSIARCTWLVLALVVSATIALAAPKADPEDLNGLLEPIREKHGVPALGAALVVGEDVVGIGATGLRRVGGKGRVTVDDRWHLGSCTKAMTATLIARLVERGDLAWDLTLEKAFPDLAETMHADYRGVSLELLLANRGGAPSSLNQGGLWLRLLQRKGSPREQRMQLVRGVLPSAPAAQPGSKFLYSNAGFAIAGAIAETHQDAAWEDLLRKELFEPLGMEDSGFGAPGIGAEGEQPWGHVSVGTSVQPVRPGVRADNPAAIGPAGIVHATLADWAKFVSLHLRGARGEKTGVLEPATFRKLHTPPEGQDYALGWISAQRGWADGVVLTHDGSNTMWYCSVWIAPKKGFAVLVTVNQGGKAATLACQEAVRTLSMHHLGK